jgi:hypothetical protein
MENYQKWNRGNSDDVKKWDMNKKTKPLKIQGTNRKESKKKKREG